MQSGAPDAARRANWMLGRNFGASAGAKRRGPGGEIYSRGPVPPRSENIANLKEIRGTRTAKSASIPPGLPPGSANMANLEVIGERASVNGAPDAARRANWMLGRNFGASAGAKRRGPGGEIYSRVSASAGAKRRGPGGEIHSRASCPKTLQRGSNRRRRYS